MSLSLSFHRLTESYHNTDDWNIKLLQQHILHVQLIDFDAVAIDFDFERGVFPRESERRQRAFVLLGAVSIFDTLRR